MAALLLATQIAEPMHRLTAHGGGGSAVHHESAPETEARADKNRPSLREACLVCATGDRARSAVLPAGAWIVAPRVAPLRVLAAAPAVFSGSIPSPRSARAPPVFA